MMTKLEPVTDHHSRNESEKLPDEYRINEVSHTEAK